MNTISQFDIRAGAVYLYSISVKKSNRKKQVIFTGCSGEVKGGAIFVPAQAFARQWLESFKEFPPRGGTTLGIDGVIKQLENPGSRQ